MRKNPETRPTPDDRGFSLVEALVALTLFGVLSSALLVTLNATVRTSNEGGERSVAASLAARELEITRDAFSSQSRGPGTIPLRPVVNPSPLPGGTVGQPLVVDGIPYTVTRGALPRSVDSAAASTCDEGTTAEMAYLTVRVLVTWPGLGDRPPLRMDTIMTPQKGYYNDATKGYIGVKVIDSLGGPQSGVTVRRSGSTTTTETGTDGCALFAGVAPGTYTITVEKEGHVTQQGLPTGTLTSTVQAGQLWRGTIAYDKAASLDVTVCPPQGYPLPPSLSVPVTLANSGLLPNGKKAFPAAGSRSLEPCLLDSDGDGIPDDTGSPSRLAEVRKLGSLWPYPSGYQVWAGSCLTNDPQTPDPLTGLPPGQPRDVSVATPAGGTSATVVELGGVTVQGIPLLSGTIVATQAFDTGCPKIGSTTYGARVELGSGLLGGSLKSSLPYGTWRIAVGSKSATVTLVKGGTPQTAALE